MCLKYRIPSLRELSGKFEDIDEFRLYLHIPFCEQICPYCPYNKEIYAYEGAEAHTSAVKREIDSYSRVVGNTPVTSFYIGGGTPTTMLHTDLQEMIEYILIFLICSVISMWKAILII